MAAGGTGILVGDVGGTRTRLALYGRSTAAPRAEAVYSSRDHAGLEEIVDAFLASSKAKRPAVAVIGIAGPVRGGVAVVTNLPWRLDERALARHLGIPQVVLLNDLAVAGAEPAGLSVAFVLEEGYPKDDLQRIIASIDKVSKETGVPVATGDTFGKFSITIEAE